MAFRLMFAALVAGFLAAQAPPPAEDPQDAAQKLFPKAERLQKLRLREVGQYLGVGAGSTLADVGCGSGEIALIWSRTVGPAGRVWAEDIDAKGALKQARKLMGKHHARNVTVIQGEPANPKLPKGQLDAIFLLDVYHEIKQQREMLAHFQEALKPGGRLAIIDPFPRKTGSRPREVQMKNHVLMPDIADADLRAAGFEIVHRDDRFLDDPDAEGVQWLLVAKPRS